MRISKTLLLCTVALAGMTVPMKNALADVKPNSIPANPSMKQDASKPVVVSTNVDGEPDVQTTGVAVFDPVKITVNTDHFTNDNLLTPDGLGWTEDTEVQIIKGHEVGEINNQKYWGQNNPQEPTIAYSFAKGDSGRITYVGKTLSGVDLDLIYTIENTDADLWEQYSGLNRIKVPRGIAFTGEQYLANTNNNSIVVLYNGANSVHLKYQIVKHDSFDEIPVLVSFITTDIDVGQGVATDLPNLAAVVPGTTNLSFQDGVVYDGSHTGPYHYGADINGSEGLPYGGYLGVSFQSHFNYAFLPQHRRMMIFIALPLGSVMIFSGQHYKLN
ncbi:hypothetical protein [Limosilactobacillus equigenerosi]|uniref:hypothetical protein n=1 Tax=Limosilactobacillus equigenerosi TaxID=417373 RepID=UPI0006D0BC25|nr:hypothetical protein [Limosilactobacillus equigenerosi]